MQPDAHLFGNAGGVLTTIVGLAMGIAIGVNISIGHSAEQVPPIAANTVQPRMPRFLPALPPEIAEAYSLATDGDADHARECGDGVDDDCIFN